jgi:hypothetical protein
MDRLGAIQLNTVWSWCGVNEDKRRVYFSIWTDNLIKDAAPRTYKIQEPDWGVSENGGKSAARNDQDAKLAFVFEKGYEAWGYFIEAKDRTAHPREIASTATSFVVRLTLSKRNDGTVAGQIIERVEIR